MALRPPDTNKHARTCSHHSMNNLQLLDEPRGAALRAITRIVSRRHRCYAGRRAQSSAMASVCACPSQCGSTSCCTRSTVLRNSAAALERRERSFGSCVFDAGPLNAPSPPLHEAESEVLARSSPVARSALMPAAQQLLAVQRFAIDEFQDESLAARFHQGEATSIHRFLLIELSLECISILSNA
jgi:hypothetical protein